MLLHREIVVDIYDSNGTDIEFSTSNHDFEIIVNSLNINMAICDVELSFGDIISSKAEVSIYNMGMSMYDNGKLLDLTNRKICISAIDTEQDDYLLATEDDDYIVTDDTDYIALDKNTYDITRLLFTGFIETYTTDYGQTYVGIVAYDWFYFHQNDNIYAWWESMWQAQAPATSLDWETVTRSFLSWLRDNKGLSYSPSIVRLQPLSTHTIYSTDLDDIIEVDSQNKKIVSAKNMFKWLLQPHLYWVYLLPSGTIYVRRIESPNTPRTKVVDIDNIERDTTDIANYTTKKINTYTFYNDATNKEIFSVRRAYSDGYASCLDFIMGARFLEHAECESLMIAITNTLYYNNDIVYTPIDMNLVMSDFNYALGDCIRIDRVTQAGTVTIYSYIMEITYSGELLVNENIKCNSQGNTLSSSIPT